MWNLRCVDKSGTQSLSENWEILGDFSWPRYIKHEHMNRVQKISPFSKHFKLILVVYSHFFKWWGVLIYWKYDMNLTLLGEWHCNTISKYNTGFSIVRRQRRDFPGGTVDKNPPATAGDLGMISGSGRFRLSAKLQSLQSRVWELQLLSPHTATTEALVPTACALQEKSPQWEAHAPQQKVGPTCCN